MTLATDGAAWLVLLAMGMPGPISLLHCDQTSRVVGVSTQSMGDVRPTTLADVVFAPDATAWERERVRDLLLWGEVCWTKGCVAEGRYDPPPPPMKCPPVAPTS